MIWLGELLVDMTIAVIWSIVVGVLFCLADVLVGIISALLTFLGVLWILRKGRRVYE